jgi:hypothetical protein
MSAVMSAGIMAGMLAGLKSVPSHSAHTAQTGNNSAMISNNRWDKRLLLLNFIQFSGQGVQMKHALAIPLICFALLAQIAPAQAADCYADYKAKQNNPLKLHYGVIQIRGACNKAAAQGEIQSRLAASGWTLLNVMAIFGPEGLQQRKANAGSYFLRF